ncbi:MAG: hypothetical protein WC720_04980 [Candidatus Shapirobacteria bacterium]|jgi:hypothetical protein
MSILAKLNLNINKKIMETIEKINVAVKSTEGHFVEKAKRVVCLDEVKEAFFVDGNAELTTKNHQTLKLEKDCLIMPQQVYNPYLKSLERSKD